MPQEPGTGPQGKDHLNLEGLQKIIDIKSAMNLGLKDIHKLELNKTKKKKEEKPSVERPIIKTETIPSPYSCLLRGYEQGLNLRICKWRRYF